MKNLLKKKSRIKVLLERSELIQFILCLLAMVLLCILNYLAAKWECSLAIPDTNSGLFYSLLLITFMAGNIVGLFLLLCILLVLKYAVVSTLTLKNRHMIEYAVSLLRVKNVTAWGYLPRKEWNVF